MLLLVWSLGALAWAWFLGFGAIPFELLDWRQEYYYYSVLRAALRSSEIPWHVAPVFHFNDRFLASPLSVLAPHVLLLRWIGVHAFALVHVLGCYTLGYLGCVRLARRYRLDWPAFLVLLLLFNFNGYPASRLCAGHTVWWAGYFLLPWLWAPILTWVERGPSTSISAEIALILFAMSLLGSFHLCTWSVILIALLGVRRTGWMVHAGAVIAGTGVLLAYRLLPGIVVFGRLAHGYPVGYPSVGDLFAGLMSLRPPVWGTLNAMGWWEYDIYVGPVGLAVLLWYGVRPLLTRRASPFTVLDLPLAGLALLSFDEVYWWTLSDVPVLAVERVVSRLLVMPVTFLSLLAAIRVEERLRARGGWRVPAWVVQGGLALLALPLLRHFAVWRPGLLAISKPAWTSPVIVPSIVNRPDAAYRMATCLGAAITLAAVVVAIRMLRRPRSEPRERRHDRVMVR